MSRFKLTLAYDGRPFAGWQVQARGRTIQGEVEAAIAQLAGPGPRVHGSGRTDAGVHALGQVAHFDAPDACRLDEGEWHRALNALLPPSIRVMRCERVGPEFHARFDATGKVYRYRLWNGEVLPPLEHGLAWHLPGRLDERALRQAARLFEGRKDFSAFCANRGEPGEEDRNRVRTLRRIEIVTRGELIELTFEGDGFLYKMVRMIVGAIVRHARGLAALDELQSLLDHPARRKPGWQAPADGLTLERVEFSPGAVATA
jgi:tRNA pseudouridine38-40 synthase